MTRLKSLMLSVVGVAASYGHLSPWVPNGLRLLGFAAVRLPAAFAQSSDGGRLWECSTGAVHRVHANHRKWVSPFEAASRSRNDVKGVCAVAVVPDASTDAGLDPGKTIRDPAAGGADTAEKGPALGADP